METFDNEGQYVIKHNGKSHDVFCVRLPERMSREAAAERYIGKDVKIVSGSTDCVYRVIGVESWPILELPKGAPIAFMVRFPWDTASDIPGPKP